MEYVHFNSLSEGILTNNVPAHLFMHRDRIGVGQNGDLPIFFWHLGQCRPALEAFVAIEDCPYKRVNAIFLPFFFE
jgi:hypothetical protein